MTTRLEVLDICIRRGGYRKGARVAEFILSWEVCVRSTGRDVSVDELVAWWGKGMARRTAFLRVGEFRELFPELGEHAKPSALMGPLLDRLRYDEPPYGADLADVPLDFGALA